MDPRQPNRSRESHIPRQICILVGSPVSGRSAKLGASDGFVLSSTVDLECPAVGLMNLRFGPHTSRFCQGRAHANKAVEVESSSPASLCNGIGKLLCLKRCGVVTQSELGKHMHANSCQPWLSCSTAAPMRNKHPKSPCGMGMRTMNL